MNSIINTIEKLKFSTNTALSVVRESKSPCYYDIKMYWKDSFSFDGFRTSQNVDSTICYLVKNLPFINGYDRVLCNKNLKTMVDNLEIYPFLLFLNNKFVKWSNIRIVNDTVNTYMFIDNILDNMPSYKMIVIPSKMIYNESTTIVQGTTRFIFNNNGLALRAISGTCTTINIDSSRIYYESSVLINSFKYKPALDSKYKLTGKNMIIFKNGLLHPTATIEDFGLNVFSVDGNNFTTSTTECKIFYHLDSNISRDNIYNIKNRSQIKNVLSETLTVIPSHIKDLTVPFDFGYNKNLLYEENIINSLSYIMKYNSGLMNDAYKEASNIVSRTYTGLYIKGLADTKGYVTMSRRVGRSTENNVIMFVNGELYNSYSQLAYIRKDFIFPIINISDTDVIEFLIFKDIDNRSTELIMNSSNGTDSIIIDPTIDMHNVKLFTMHPEKSRFNIDINQNIQYEIDFVVDRTSADVIQISPANSFYYDKTLSLVSSRQFRYVLKVITEECISFKLPDYFRFCNDNNKFLIFLNSRKIDKDNYRLTTIGIDNPFTNISIYTNIMLKPKDRLEVFYLADNMEETIIKPSIPLSGDIIIDKTKLSYNLSKDLYFIFINGKKIHNDNIIDLDANKMKIITNIKTINNLCIAKHIKDNEVMTSIFNTVTDTMTQSLNSMSTSDLDTYYNSDYTIVNSEANTRKNIFNMKTTMYEIIKDYWLKPNINTGDVFAYDYDNSFFTEKDSDGNTTIKVVDANLKDKFSD